MAEYVYLDSHATTPVDEHVRRAMEPYWNAVFANPGSSHRAGQQARQGIEWARSQLAAFVGRTSHEVIFTGSATEANNLALQGLIQRYYQDYAELPHIITSTIEHSAVLSPLRRYAEDGLIELTELPVTKEGEIHRDELAGALQANTICVSLMYANNEIGTITQLSEMSRVIAEWRREVNSMFPYFHTDAVQAGFFLACDMNKLGVDMLTLSAHKMYGPKGVGALCVREDISLSPLLYGGDQEYTLRPGTHNVPAIVGFGMAINRLFTYEHKNEVAHITHMQTTTWELLETYRIPFVRNGSRDHRLPNNIHISLPGFSAEELLIYLDLNGVAVSGGSACHSGAWTPSHVMEAMTDDTDRVHSAIRIGLLRSTTPQELEYGVSLLKDFVTSDS